MLSPWLAENSMVEVEQPCLPSYTILVVGVGVIVRAAPKVAPPTVDIGIWMVSVGNDEQGQAVRSSLGHHSPGPNLTPGKDSAYISSPSVRAASWTVQQPSAPVLGQAVASSPSPT